MRCACEGLRTRVVQIEKYHALCITDNLETLGTYTVAGLLYTCRYTIYRLAVATGYTHNIHEALEAS